MHLLLFIFIFILVIALIIFSLFRGILRFLFGGLFKKKTYSNQKRYSDKGQYYQRNQNNQQKDTEKVFSKDEGEYVQYEEIE